MSDLCVARCQTGTRAGRSRPSFRTGHLLLKCFILFNRYLGRTTEIIL